jgi:division protein CdvB (Snf7/Vps24/ESCRT-III family)
VGAISFIKKFEDRLHSVPLKERIAQASYRLQAQFDRLDQMYTKLQQRDRDLFQRCVGAQVSKDTEHARLYANECAEIRKIAKVVLGSQLALEKVILRLETVKDFGDIMLQLAPVMSIVKDTKSKIAGIVPQVATELEEVNDTLADLTNEATTETVMPELPIEATDDEAKKVLEETGMVAEQKLRDHFPDLPNLETPPTTADRILEISAPAPARDFEDRILEYAKKHNGQFSLHGCANDLGATPDLIQNTLERLRENGRIVIE